MQTIEKVKELAKGYDIVPVFRYGYDRFSKKCAEVGIDGFIIPDMPYEQSIEIAAGRKRLSSNENNSVTVFLYMQVEMHRRQKNERIGSQTTKIYVKNKKQK